MRPKVEERRDQVDSFQIRIQEGQFRGDRAILGSKDRAVAENGQTGSLDYVYVTSAGFHTTGTFVLGEDGSWTAEEAVTGHDTITRVRSTGRITPEGTMTMTSEYFAKGEWSPGRNVVYAEVDAGIPEITGKLSE